jgi:DNA-directed RNA polymerase subunit alpha
MAVTRIPIPDWAKVRRADERLDLSLAETSLCVRTVNCLEDEGIFTIRDLLNCTPKRLLEIPNLGGKTLRTIYRALEELGFPSSAPQTAEPSADTPRTIQFALLRDDDDSDD